MSDTGVNPPAGRQSLGGYELIRKLGEGGMGATYLARQVSMDRLVALKVLKKGLAKKAGFVERFVREAHLAGRLSHANIVQALDVGEAGGFHYLAMDYVEGQTASALIPSGGAMPEAQALDIALQVARALEAAHRQGIVHRDVKPENILVTAEGIAKLCDFGLAREAEGESGLTQTGTALGTPHYIAPEQARGEGGVDVRADIYSLGATLYHLVTGRTPFEGPTAAVVAGRQSGGQRRLRAADRTDDGPGGGGPLPDARRADRGH
jgi:serine/threonine-protein kinase